MATDLKSKERFSSRVSSYAYRPSYPVLLLRELRDRVPAPHPHAVDIGSGTGIFTRLLLAHGFTVDGVEPNAEMRSEAERVLSDIPGFRSVAGEAGRTTLADNSADLITAAQSFHWFANEEAAAEFNRVLRPHGTIALIWNDRHTDINRFHRVYEDLLLRHCPEYKDVDHRNIGEETIKKLFSDRRIERREHQNHHALDLTGFVGRVESCSYVPLPGSDAHRILMTELRGLFSEEASEGMITMKYRCTAYYLSKND